MDLQRTEIYLYLSIFLSFVALLVLVIGTKFTKSILAERQKPAKKEKKSNPGGDVLEIFDYLGTKIIHENGKYTVNHNGKLSTFSWESLPDKYKRMIKELDQRSLKAKQNDDYFLECINGIYYLTMPGGKRKRYEKLSDIPENIRRAVGK